MMKHQTYLALSLALATLFIGIFGFARPVFAQTDDVELSDGTYTMTVDGEGDSDQAATIAARRNAVRAATIERLGRATYKKHRSLIDEQIVQYPGKVVTDQKLLEAGRSEDGSTVSVTLEIAISKSKLEQQLSSLALLDQDEASDEPSDTPDSTSGDPGMLTDLGHRGESTESSDSPDSKQSANQPGGSSQTNAYARGFPTLDFEIGLDVRGGIPSAADVTLPISIGYDTGLWRGGIVAEFGIHRPHGAPSEDDTEGDGGFALGGSITRTLWRSRQFGTGVRTRATLLYQVYEGECLEYGPEFDADGPQCQRRRSDSRNGGAFDAELSLFKDVPLAARIEGGLSGRVSTIYGAMLGGFLRVSWGSTH